MKVNIQQINGEWHLGYVLDKHTESSEFLGHDQWGHPKFNNIRTDVGEAIYRLKNQNDRAQIPLLADVFIKHLGSKFSSVSLIVPMPPSKERNVQPVIELSRAIAQKMNIGCFENILSKKIKTNQMKDIEGYDDKMLALKGAFDINKGISNEGCWDVLLIDDLYDTGASLNSAVRILKTYSKFKNIYVGVFTRTK